MEYTSLEGTWQVSLPDGLRKEMHLPGTLDENAIGCPDHGSEQAHLTENAVNGNCDIDEAAPIATRFTRNYTFEGEARLSRKVTFRETPGKRVFLEAERARVLRLFIDGMEIPHSDPPSISTPQVFEVTGRIGVEHELTLLSDNSYPGLPRDAIVYSSAATDETQTNWNGVLGYLRLREKPETFIRAVRVYPKGNSLTIKVEIDAAETFEGVLTLYSEVFAGEKQDTLSLKMLRVDSTVDALFIEKNTSYLGGVVKAPGKMTIQVNTHAGRSEIVMEGVALRSDILRWDEEEGNLYELTATLSGNVFSGQKCPAAENPASGNCGDEACTLEDSTSKDAGKSEEICSELTVRFGIRDFGDNGSGRLALNGRTFFLRGEANCAVFPETGYPPMDKESWKDILSRYRAYGVNCMRFHSHCPPEAAFAAADELGMLMQPELSHWNPKNAFEDKESFRYYQTELEQILRTLANHPSFVMLTFGNELWSGEVGLARMHQMLEWEQAFDPTRLYAIASNGFYGTKGCDEQSDFYTSMSFGTDDLRGTYAGYEGQNGIQGYINNCYPGTCTDFCLSMEKLRQTYKKPVFSFEVGQFEVLPDFGELDAFHGVTRPANLKLIQEKARAAGLIDWRLRVEATGELALIGYREEVEAAMRTRELSGISLLGLQDFPGQGTSLVGMMNSHLQPKPYSFAQPERFQAFFHSQQILVRLPRYTWESDETLTAEIQVANYGKQEICAPVYYELRVKKNVWETEDVAIEDAARGRRCGEFSCMLCPTGALTDIGRLEIPLSFAEHPQRLELYVWMDQTRSSDHGEKSEEFLENSYPLWVYPVCAQIQRGKASDAEVTLDLEGGAAGSEAEPFNEAETFYETEHFDSRAREVLVSGGIVYLTPPATQEALPYSIKTQFTTDFWSVGNFPAQQGGMGQLIDADHPLFCNFPTEFHTNWQWWPMATQWAIILPEYKKSIAAEMDSYAYMRPMTQLLECRCGGGRLLLSSMGLQNLTQYPEARALQRAIYTYLTSDRFQPEQEMDVETVARLVP